MDEQANVVVKSSWGDRGLVGLVAFGAGVGVGYILWRRPKPYVLHAVPDPVDMDIHPEDLQRSREEATEEHPASAPEISVAPIVEQRIKESMTKVHDPEAEEPVITHNVFAGNDEDWDYEAEVASRTKDIPYVLHKDEFHDDEKDYTQTTLTYYAGDNIMTDQDDTPIYNFGHVVGPLKFGHGSGDPNVFFVRNDKRHEEWEIVKHTGTYSEEILGLEIEENARAGDIKHSNQRKFRDSD